MLPDHFSPDERVNLAVFAALTVLAWIRPSKWVSRRAATGLGLAGIAIVFATRFADPIVGAAAAQIVRDWFPAALLLFVYWQAGQFRQPPSERFQSILVSLDLGLLPVGSVNTPFLGGIVENYFEFAYLFCYPFVPLGIAALYATHHREYVTEYWYAVLPSAYLCYVLVAFVRVLPPRLLGAREGAPQQRHASGIRRFNLWILNRASIQVNTFPSAHVAASMAASFVILRAMPVVGTVFLIVATSIAIGAVIGRYHYAIDAFAAILWAAIVFWLTRPMS